MIVKIILLCILYIVIGAILGGLYYYLRHKYDEYDDIEDMYFLPIWIAFLWILIAPLAFAIHYAKIKAERDGNE